MADPGRRQLVGGALLAGAGFAGAGLWPGMRDIATGQSGARVDLGLAGGGGGRPVSDAFPGKRGMIVQRMRAPLLETPMAAMDGHVITPNDRFFVRWHYDDIPTRVDPQGYRLRIGGAVRRPLALGLADLMAMPRIEMTAINQCSGNSRGHFWPRVPGAQWGNGAIGNARWAGVCLRDVLDRAGVLPGAVSVRAGGMDRPPPGAPPFEKSLAIDHARDGEVMLAFLMNGEALPLLHGAPLRLVVPGWFSTYWVKAVDRLEVLTTPDTGYWMDKAYRLPAVPGHSVTPDAKDYPTEPISRMVPRAFFTNIDANSRIRAGSPVYVRGLAMGGDRAVRWVDISLNGGRWYPARLGADEGRYSFRLWEARLPALPAGRHSLRVRATNTAGETQVETPVWNPGGFLRNSIERIEIEAA